jgi:hypothetical protein
MQNKLILYWLSILITIAFTRFSAAQQVITGPAIFQNGGNGCGIGGGLISQGCTGATTQAGAFNNIVAPGGTMTAPFAFSGGSSSYPAVNTLSNLGGVSLTQTTPQTMSGALNVPLTDSMITPTASNTYLFASGNYSFANVQSDFNLEQSGTNNFTAGIVGAVHSLSTSTQYQINGVAGFVKPGNTNPAVALYGQALCTITSSNCFGFNPLAADVPGITAGVTLQGGEVDVNVNNAADLVSGIDIKGSWSAQPSNSTAFDVAKPGSFHWQNAYFSNGGAAVNALVAGQQGTGAANSSQNIVFLFSEPSGTSASDSMFVNDLGQFVFTSQFLGGMLINGTYTGASSGDTNTLLLNPTINYTSGGSGLWGLHAVPFINVGTGLTSGEVSAVWADGAGMTLSGTGTVPLASGIFASQPTFGTVNLAGLFSGSVKTTGQLQVGNLSGSIPTNGMMLVNGTFTGSSSVDTGAILVNPTMTYAATTSGMWGIISKPAIISTTTISKVAAVWGNGAGMTLTGGGSSTLAAGGYFDVPTIGTSNYAVYASGPIFSTGTINGTAITGTSIVDTGIAATSGTPYVCVNTSGQLVKSATACSGT